MENGRNKIYQQLAADMQKEWRACEPLRQQVETNKTLDKINYNTWNESKRNAK